MNKGILYKGVVLMPGSTAYQLLQDKEFKKLDAHMKKLDDEYHRLHFQPPVVDPKLAIY